MQVNSEIKIVDLVGRTLDSRDEAIKVIEGIMDYCPQCGNIVLDFTDVDFMSRSFADEFHKQKLNWVNKTGTTILIYNENTQVSDILKSVAKTQNNHKKEINNFPSQSFLDDELYSYLRTIR